MYLLQVHDEPDACGRQRRWQDMRKHRGLPRPRHGQHTRRDPGGVQARERALDRRLARRVLFGACRSSCSALRAMQGLCFWTFAAQVGFGPGALWGACGPEASGMQVRKRSLSGLRLGITLHLHAFPALCAQGKALCLALPKGDNALVQNRRRTA